MIDKIVFIIGVFCGFGFVCVEVLLFDYYVVVVGCIVGGFEDLDDVIKVKGGVVMFVLMDVNEMDVMV